MLFAYLLIGVACALLEPSQPQSVIATVCLCAALTIATKGTT